MIEELTNISEVFGNKTFQDNIGKSMYEDSERDSAMEFPESKYFEDDEYEDGNFYPDSNREDLEGPEWDESNLSMDSIFFSDVEIDIVDMQDKVLEYLDDEHVDKTEKNENNIESKEIDKSNIKEAPENDNETENTPETEEVNEDKELSEEEINEKQQAAIKDGLERIIKGEKLTNEELGNLGEMMMDQYYISKGYKPLNLNRVTSLDDKKSGFKTGIDGVYEKTNPDGTKTYVIADAKYNKSQLSETNDGKQMSDNWINKRLDDAVGKEKADEIRDAAEDNPDSVKQEVYRINPSIDGNGNIHIYTDIQKVDSEGNKVGDKTSAEYFDKHGNRLNSSLEE